MKINYGDALADTFDVAVMAKRYEIVDFLYLRIGRKNSEQTLVIIAARGDRH